MTAWVYIMTNKPNGVLYVGVTSDLKGRVAKHKAKTYPNSFSAQYNLDKLVYFEKIDGMSKAIDREKQLKAGNRARKLKLIEGMNPEWRDLSSPQGLEGRRPCLGTRGMSLSSSHVHRAHQQRSHHPPAGLGGHG